MYLLKVNQPFDLLLWPGNLMAALCFVSGAMSVLVLGFDLLFQGRVPFYARSSWHRFEPVGS